MVGFDGVEAEVMGPKWLVPKRWGRRGGTEGKETKVVRPKWWDRSCGGRSSGTEMVWAEMVGRSDEAEVSKIPYCHSLVTIKGKPSTNTNGQTVMHST